MTVSLTQLNRLPNRGSHDRAVVDEILDAGLVAHVGFLRQGQPAVVPTLYVRHHDEVLFHGSPASTMLRAAKSGADLCLTVTHFDGLVLARSAFHHSANYRSVVVYGKARWIGREERAEALERILERIVPGRSVTLRPMTHSEVAGTAVIALPLDQASAKVRTGPPVDEEADYSLPIWAGVLPVVTRFGSPWPDPRNPATVDMPPHVEAMAAAGSAGRS